jgi:hypothetical protein
MQCQAYLASPLSPDAEHSTSLPPTPSLSFLQLSKVSLPSTPASPVCLDHPLFPSPVLQRIYCPHNNVLLWYISSHATRIPPMTPLPPQATPSTSPHSSPPAPRSPSHPPSTHFAHAKLHGPYYHQEKEQRLQQSFYCKILPTILLRLKFSWGPLLLHSTAPGC